jgi:hypothetical protein
MQAIFQYDLNRLNAYSVIPSNRIAIRKDQGFISFCFPDVSYFNYTVQLNGQPLSRERITEINEFYQSKCVGRHKLIVPAYAVESVELLKSLANYTQTAVIAKTAFATAMQGVAPSNRDIEFIPVDHSLIDQFTTLYLRGFDAENRDINEVTQNFCRLFRIDNLDLFMLSHKKVFVGVNVLYYAEQETVLAGGAVLPEYRNRGFHQNSLQFRIGQALSRAPGQKIVGWAYKPGISLRNMLKQGMNIEEEFFVYEYCR